MVIDFRITPSTMEEVSITKHNSLLKTTCDNSTDWDNVKYSLAHNMRQGKNSHCAVKKVMRRKRLTYELHDSYFRSMMITPAIPKIADVTHPNGQ